MKTFRDTSLTTRLGILLALVAILTFAGVGTYLYHSLSNQLEARDDQELIGKIGLMRHLAQEATSIDAIRRNPHLFLDAVVSHDQMIVLLKAADGKLVLENLRGQGELPRIKVVPVGIAPPHDAIAPDHNFGWSQRTGGCSTSECGQQRRKTYYYHRS